MIIRVIWQHFSRWAYYFGFGLLLCLSQALAKPAESIAQPVVPVRPNLPAVDPKNELHGKALLAALRAGGLVLYMRHAETGNVTATCDVSNLSARGETDAKAVGNALRKLAIPVGHVISSPVCRALDTARLLDMGVPKTDAGLSNLPAHAAHDLHAARASLLATFPALGANTILVGHFHAGANPGQRLFLDLAEVIVFRQAASIASMPASVESAAPVPVARITVAQWQVMLADSDSSTK